MFARQSGRRLTAQEVALSRTIFGDAIDYRRVRIHHRKWWLFQPKRITMAPDGHLWFHPKGGLFCDDYCEAGADLQGHFLHEMTHVWQHQRGIFLPLRRLPFARYHYSIKPGWPLERYGLEQQAEIVRHLFLLRNGRTVVGAPPVSVYESIVSGSFWT